MVTSGATDVAPQKLAQPTPVQLVTHDIGAGREITYFTATGQWGGVTTAGGTFYSISGQPGDVLFRSPAEAQAYAATKGQQITSQVGVSDVPSSKYWEQKQAEEARREASYGGVRTEIALAPIGAPVPGSQLAAKKAMLESGTAQFASEQAFKEAAQQVGAVTPVSAKGIIVTPQFKTGEEQLRAMQTPTTIAPIPLKPKPSGRTEFGYIPIDVNYLIGTPEAKGLTQQYRESMPRFQVQTGKVIETYAYNQGIFLTDMFGGKTEVKPGMRYMRDIFGFTSETPMITGVPKVTEEQAAGIRFSEQIGLVGASTGAGGILTTTAGLRGATFIQPGDFASIARSFNLASRKMFGRPGLIGETAREISPVTKGVEPTMRSVFGRPISIGEVARGISPIKEGMPLTTEAMFGKGDIIPPKISIPKGLQEFISSEEATAFPRQRTSQVYGSITSQYTPSTQVEAVGVVGGKLVTREITGTVTVISEPEISTAEIVSGDIAHAEAQYAKAMEAGRLELARLSQKYGAVELTKTAQVMTPVEIAVTTPESISVGKMFTPQISVPVSLALTQQKQLTRQKQEARQLSISEQITKQMRISPQPGITRQITEQPTPQKELQIPIQYQVAPTITTPIYNTPEIPAYVSPPIVPSIPITPTEPPKTPEVPQYKPPTPPPWEPPIPKIPPVKLFEDDRKKRKAKPRKKEAYTFGYRATPLIEPLAGIKDLFKSPKYKRTKKSKKAKK